MIVHIGNRIFDGRDEAIRIASTNIHLTKGAYRLLKYYGDCKEGFRPSMSVITEATNIISDHIARYRTELIKKGLIAYDRKHVFVDWRRIRILAMTDIAMMGKKNIIYFPVKIPETENTVNDWNITDKYQRFYSGYIATLMAKKNGLQFPEEEKLGYITDREASFSSEEKNSDCITDIDLWKYKRILEKYQKNKEINKEYYKYILKQKEVDDSYDWNYQVDWKVENEVPF